MGAVLAVTMVRDELDILPYTLTNMLAQVDAVLVADNGSVDGTREWLAEAEREHAGRLLVVDDPEVGYYQSAKMTALAVRASRDFLGLEPDPATWVVPFDADEWWYTPFAPTIAELLRPIAEQWLVMPARLYDHVVTADDFAREMNPCRRIGFRRPDPAPLPKVACRLRADLSIDMGNHGATYTGGATVHDSQLVVHHYPYRTAEQVIRKVRNGAEAYAATGDTFDETVGAHWRQWGKFTDDQLVEAFTTWHTRTFPRTEEIVGGSELQPALVWDPVGPSERPRRR